MAGLTYAKIQLKTFNNLRTLTFNKQMNSFRRYSFLATLPLITFNKFHTNTKLFIRLCQKMSIHGIRIMQLSVHAQQTIRALQEQQ